MSEEHKLEQVKQALNSRMTAHAFAMQTNHACEFTLKNQIESLHHTVRVQYLALNTLINYILEKEEANESRVEQRADT